MRRDTLDLIARQNVVRRRGRFWTPYRIRCYIAALLVAVVLWMFALLLADAPVETTSDLYLNDHVLQPQELVTDTLSDALPGFSIDRSGAKGTAPAQSHPGRGATKTQVREMRDLLTKIDLDWRNR